MRYLLATILLNTLLSAVFKLLPRYRLDALQAIVVNYWVCVITGSFFIGYFPLGPESIVQVWFPWSLLMGVGFICVFNLFAYSTRIDGITTATVSNKLSLAIPVICSLILYKERVGICKTVGILLAFPAVYFTTKIKEDNGKVPQLIWPALLFIGSGLLDTLMKYVQTRYLYSAELQAVYSVHVFAMAGTIGGVLIILLVIAGKIELHWHNLVAGILIGIPNYFSIYFLIRMLNSNMLQSSAAFPVNNIGIVVASSLMAILFFKEKINARRIAGLVLAITAILLIAFGDK